MSRHLSSSLYVIVSVHLVILPLLLLPSPVQSAFGDRIRPITPNPLYTRAPNTSVAKPPYTLVPPKPRLTTTTTTPLPPTEESPGSPEPDLLDDLVSETPVDEILSDNSDQNSLDNQNEDRGIYGDDENSMLEMHSSSSSPNPLIDDDTTEFYNTTDLSDISLDSDISSSPVYPLDPPNTLSNHNLSSSDTYSRFQYAVPPLGEDQVVFISSLQPKHPLSIYPPVKKVIKVIEGDSLPTYRDGGPRIRYIKKPTYVKTRKLPPHPRYPTHMHPAKITPLGELIKIHSHEYHHHPSRDVSYYGYIPGIPGKPWKDYPIFSSVPPTGFSCKLTKYPGFYADIDAGCQVWHYCQLDGRHDKFLCPNGTLFNQATRVCDWWFNVDCPSSLWKYDVNRDMYQPPLAPPVRKVKKVLHIHPGKEPHVHKIPKISKGVYVYTGLGGTSTYPISLSRKVHKHHFGHHPHGPGDTFIPRGHPIVHKKIMEGRAVPGYPIYGGAPHPHGRLPHVRVRKVVIPGHHAHHIHHRSGHRKHTIHHLPIDDPLGNIPSHGHLILHHKTSAKK